MAAARRVVEQRRIDYASTARGAHNLQIEANAHEQCGQLDQARAIRRTIARGLARRRAADTRDQADGRQWAPPQMRGSGSRCPECGQYVGGNHSCPQVVRDARRRALAAHATGPVSHPGHTTDGAAAAGELSRHMFDTVSLDADEAAAISAICADARYDDVHPCFVVHGGGKDARWRPARGRSCLYRSTEIGAPPTAPHDHLHSFEVPAPAEMCQTSPLGWDLCSSVTGTA